MPLLDTTTWESITKVSNYLFSVRAWRSEDANFMADDTFKEMLLSVLNSGDFADAGLINNLAEAILALEHVAAVEVLPINNGAFEDFPGVVLYKNWP